MIATIRVALSRRSGAGGSEDGAGEAKGKDLALLSDDRDTRRHPASLGPAPPDPQRAPLAAPDKKQRLASDARGLAALAIYFALAVFFFARGLAGRFSTAYIGHGADPQGLMWLMAWWPHAIRHGLNPFYSQAVWAPQGVSLAWTTCMPLLSLVLAPVVLTMGPAFAYNISVLLAVALAGWCAFILCRAVTNAYWPSLAGGYLFGFSSYMLGQAGAHLNEMLIFPVPLFALLLIRGFRADISRRSLVAGVALLTVAQAGLALEVFATMTVFAVIAMLIVLITGSAADRNRLTATVPLVALGYAIAVAALSPYFYYMFALGYEHGAIYSPLLYSTDLVNLLVPTAMTELGQLPALQAISGRFLGTIYEAGGYVGIPLALVAAAFARRNWNERWARLLVIFLLTAMIFSFGPFLLVGGRVTLPLPGAALMLLPLVGKALPARFMLYGFLALALMTTIWLATSRSSSAVRVLAALIVGASILPNLSAGSWITLVDLPSFFKDKLYTKYIKYHENIVILPYGIGGNSMLWQLESGWHFRMAGGYLGPPPREFRGWPVIDAFYSLETVALPAAGDQLRAFLGAHQVGAVLVDDRQADLWRPLLASLGVQSEQAGGITFYRVPATELARWSGSTALEMEIRADRARFAALVLGAEARMRSGGDLSSLTPTEALKAAALPAGWVMVPPKSQPPYEEGGLNLPRHPADPHLFAGMWLNAGRGGTIEIGIVGRYPALHAVLDEYRAEAVDFAPHTLANAPVGNADNRRAMLVMTFTAKGLARAARIARGVPNETSAKTPR